PGRLPRALSHHPEDRGGGAGHRVEDGHARRRRPAGGVDPAAPRCGMIATARMRLRDRLPRLDRLLVDPPHRMLRRAVETGWKCGLLEMTLRDPAAIARIALREGLGIRSVHRLHAALDPARPAIVDAHRTITYGEVDAEIDAC